jgi:hypothetical protein
VYQLQRLMYNILILRIFHDNQKEASVDKLRHDLYSEEWKAVKNQGYRETISFNIGHLTPALIGGLKYGVGEGWSR